MMKKLLNILTIFTLLNVLYCLIFINDNLIMFGFNLILSLVVTLMVIGCSKNLKETDCNEWVFCYSLFLISLFAVCLKLPFACPMTIVSAFLIIISELKQNKVE